MNKAQKKKNPKKTNPAVLLAVEELLDAAHEKVKENQELSKHYVELARETAMAKNVRLPSELRRRFCRSCHQYLLPGFNCKVRTANDCIIYHCEACKPMSKIRIK